MGCGVWLVVVGVGRWLNWVTNNSWVGLTEPGYFVPRLNDRNVISEGGFYGF